MCHSSVKYVFRIKLTKYRGYSTNIFTRILKPPFLCFRIKLQTLSVMKKVFTFIALVSLPIISMGQTQTAHVDTKAKEKTIEVSTKIEVKADSQAKIEVLNLNHKKSNDLISIKAYRKSLQIKVKSVKMC